MEFAYENGGYSMLLGYYTNNEGDLTYRYRTGCCALAQISLDNNNTVEEIQDIINLMKVESQRNIDLGRRDGGERAIFVTTISDEEEELEKKLESVGFKFVYEFHRRKGNDDDSMLKLWIISW